MNKTPAIDDRTAASQEGVRAPAFPRSAFRELEAALSDPLFFGIPLGATLNDHFITAFVDGLGDWRRRTKWLRRLLYHRHRISPKIHRRTGPTFAPGRVLVTWSVPSHRYDRLLLPVLERLGEGECAVLHGHDGVAPLVPAGIPHLPYREVMDFDARAWRREYEQVPAIMGTHHQGRLRPIRLPGRGVRTPVPRADGRQPDGSLVACSSWKPTDLPSSSPNTIATGSGPASCWRRGSSGSPR